MTKPGLLAIILMLAAGWSQAAQWARVGGGGGNAFYIDKASIIR